ncbi:MAG: extracellular solute-binding protein [Micropruina sp.]
MTTKLLAGIATITVAAAALAGCTSAPAAASCTNEIVKPDALQVSVWAWYPAFEEVVDLFNNSHNDVQICWTNAGQGNDEYTKFSTSIEAGKGAPDVIMLEAEVLSSFSIRNALVDLAKHGAAEVKADYTAGAWKDVSSGSSVYAIPVDGGPMGMLYRQDILDKHKIKVPTTWAEFADAAQKLKDAGAPGVLANFPPNGRAYTQALFAQAGSVPFTYDSAQPQSVGIDVIDEGSKKVLAYWDDLVAKGLINPDEAFTADYNTKLVDGSYAIYVAAAWGPGYLKGLEGADESAQWRAAPIPQWDTAKPVQINWGGSTFAVTSQAKDPAAAALVAKEVFGTQEAWKVGIEKGALFPLWKPVLNSDYFRDLEYPFFDGQQINKDVFLDAAAGYPGFTFSPFQNYAYDQLQQEVTAVVVDQKKAPAEGLDGLQTTLETYAKDQGFTLK